MLYLQVQVLSFNIFQHKITLKAASSSIAVRITDPYLFPGSPWCPPLHTHSPQFHSLPSLRTHMLHPGFAELLLVVQPSLVVMSGRLELCHMFRAGLIRPLTSFPGKSQNH